MDGQQLVTTGDSVESWDCLSTCCVDFITCCRTVCGHPGSEAGRASLWFSERQVPKVGRGNRRRETETVEERGPSRAQEGRSVRCLKPGGQGVTPGCGLEWAAYPLSLFQ